MVDPEAVRRRLREIDRRLSALTPILDQGRDRFLAEGAVRAQVERHLQIVLQSAIDIAVHIVAEDSPVTPEDYGSAFEALGRMNIIDDDLASELRRAAGLRNILVHAYLDIDPERLWGDLENVDDLRRFAEVVEAYLPD